MTTVREAVRSLLTVCNGAATKDHQGFNAFDSTYARTMSAKSPWSELQESAVYRMLKKYTGQLSGKGIDYKRLEFESGGQATSTPIERRKDATKLSHDRPATVKRVNTVTLKDGVFRLASDFSFKDTAKSLRGGRWNSAEKTWDYSVDPSTAEGILKWAEQGLVLAGPKALAKASAVLEEYKANPQKAKAKYGLFPYVWHEGKLLKFKGPYSSLGVAKSIPQARWNKEERLWNYPAILPCAEKILSLVEDGEVYVKNSTMDFLQGLLAKHEAQTEVVSNLKHGELVKMDVPLKTKLFDHQYRAFNIGTTLNAAGFFMEQGTGKTLAALSVAGHRYLAGEVRRLVVIAPLSVTGSWEAEIKKFAAFPVKVFNLATVKGAARKALAALAAKHSGHELTVILVNYESVWDTVGKKRKLVVHSNIKDFKPQMVICDESQKIKNHTSKQSRAIHQLGASVKYRLLLTGTPVTQSPLDFFSQFIFLDPTIFGKSFPSFRNEYAEMGGYMNYEIVGYKNLGKLAHKAHSVAYRVTKEECLDLPDTLDQVIEVGLADGAKKPYEQMMNDSIIKLSEAEQLTAPLAITQMIRLQQITGGTFPVFDWSTGDKIRDEWVGSSKLDALRDILETAPSNKKFIIFARFVPEIDHIQALCAKLKRKIVVLDGRYKGDRQKLVEQFQNDDKTTIFLSQISTGGVGITLTAADTTIFYSTTFSYAEYEQARARNHRIGQKNKVTYIHLVVKNTIDEEVLYVLQTKGDISQLVVDVLKKGAKAMKIDGNTKELQVKMRELKERVDKESKRKPREEDMPTVDEPVVVKEKKKKVRIVEEAPKKKFRGISIQLPDADGKFPKRESRPTSSSGDLVSLAELAEELGVEPKQIRKKLRKLPEFDRSGGRWEWDSDDPKLIKIRKMFKKGA